MHDRRRCVGDASAPRSHPDARVRLGVVSCLMCCDDETAVSHLIELGADPDDGVRDWATFGLAEMVAADSAAIRAALRARLSDTHKDIRAEAICGLARRKEAGLIPLLLQELEEGLSTPLLSAAAELAGPALCDALAAVEGGIDRWCVRAAWDEARAACGYGKCGKQVPGAG